MEVAEAYRILGVSPGATHDEINSAFRELAQIMHPDRFAGNKQLGARAEEQFKRISAARDLLLSAPPADAPQSDASATAPSEPVSAAQAAHAMVMSRLAAIEEAQMGVFHDTNAIRKSRDAGLVFLAGGSLLTAIGMASTASGVFFVFWGAMIWGAYRAIRATWWLFKAHAEWRRLEDLRLLHVETANELEVEIVGSPVTQRVRRSWVPYAGRVAVAVPLVLLIATLLGGGIALAASADSTVSSEASGQSDQDYFNAAGPILTDGVEAYEDFASSLQALADGESVSTADLTDEASRMEQVADALREVPAPSGYAASHAATIEAFDAFAAAAREAVVAKSSGSDAAWERVNTLYDQGQAAIARANADVKGSSTGQ